MVAGRELEILVCEHIFGWTWVTEDDEQPHQTPFLVSPDRGIGIYYPKVAAQFPDIQPTFLPPYSTSIAAAWEVVEKLKADGWDIHLDSVGFNNDIEGEWRTFFSLDDESGDQCAWVHEDGDTAAESICKCALAAVGIPPTSEETE